MPLVQLTVLRAAADRYGLIRRSDVVPAVVSASAWHRAHEREWLTAVFPGVSRLADVPTSTRQSARAACLAVGPDALVAGPTAAVLWCPTLQLDAPAHVVSRRRSRSPDLAGVVVHRPTVLADTRRSTRHGIPTTSPVRAVIDTAAWHPDHLSTVLETMLVAGWFQLAAVESLLRRHARSGRPGVVALRSTLAEWALGDRPPDSVLEARMATVCRRHRLPPFEFQVGVGPYRVDFLWPRERVVLECDGWIAHGSRSDFERDRERDAWLHSHGHVVFRFTWRQITRQSTVVADRLRAGLAHRSAQLSAR